MSQLAAQRPPDGRRPVRMLLRSSVAYLFSRCTPLTDLDPAGMGGGRGVTDFATDPELEYLRSDAQPSCS